MTMYIQLILEKSVESVLNVVALFLTGFGSSTQFLVFLVCHRTYYLGIACFKLGQCRHCQTEPANIADGFSEKSQSQHTNQPKKQI